MMHRVHGVYSVLASLTVLLGVCIGLKMDRAYAYVLPSQQLLQFMAVHFSKFDTLVIQHAVERESGEGVKDFEEILAMKSPDFIHGETRGQTVNASRVVDRTYRILFLASIQKRASDLLRAANVDTGKVSFTRVDGTIAYLIGDRQSESPKLAVEKARFLPLLFVYPSGLVGGSALIRVTFRDYRQIDQGWYPFDILCTGNGWTEHYKINSIQVNVPVRPSLFLKAQEESRSPEGPANDKIDSIIKTFEQKYGQ
jgi:hypothetical protein